MTVVGHGIPRPELQASAKSSQDLDFDGGHHFPRWLRRRPAAAPHETREELIAELVEGGFLEQELRLTDKSRELLDADPTTMDDYLYWCVHIHARKAAALVEGRSVTRAAIGGPQTDEERVAMTRALGLDS